MRQNGERGQSTVEWIGLLLVVSVLAGALAALAGVALPGTALARAIGGRIVCALELAGRCGPLAPSELALAYGDELGALVGATAPQIRYERGMRALPVDFRSCREDACAEGRPGIRVARSLTGETATVFAHVVDCRPGSETAGAVCTGAAAGNRYLQYWLYYPHPHSRAVSGLNCNPIATRFDLLDEKRVRSRPGTAIAIGAGP